MKPKQIKRWATIAVLLISAISVGASPNGKLTERFFAHASLPPSTEWSKTYGGTDQDGAYCVMQTIDGGYAFAGFTNSYGANNHDFWLVKADSSGSLLWSKTYGGNGIDDAYSVIQTNDGGYAMAGFTNSSGAGNYDGWLVKLDSVGNMQWNKTYGGATADDLYTIVQTDDGGYASVGYTTSFGAGAADGRLIKVDSSGNLVWSQTYGGTGVDDLLSMVKTSDGGYALVGYTRSFGAGKTDGWLVKVDSDGALQWNKTYGGVNDDAAHSVVQTSDGGYALAGVATSFGAGDNDFWLLKVDSSGNLQWSKTFGGAGTDLAVSLVNTNDGGYALTGYTDSLGAGNNDVWLVKTDSSGNLEWSQTFGGAKADYAYYIIQTSDGGYALTGNTASFGEGSNDCYFVKLAAESPSSSPSVSPTSTPTPAITATPMSTPTPPPVYSATPNSTQASTPTSMPTQTAFPNPSPSVPEFPSLLIPSIILVAATFGITVYKRKHPEPK